MGDLTMSLSQLGGALKAGRIEPVYMFEGEEPWLHDEGIRLLDRALFGHSDPGFARDLVWGDEASLAEVLDLASTYAMGGGRRMVVVRAAGRLAVENPSGLKAYLARPNPDTCLVFSDAKFDRRKSVTGELLNGAALIDCAPLDERRMALWARERLQERGFGIGPDLFETIMAGLSADGLGRLSAEIEKLMSAIGEPRAITPDDLSLLVSLPRADDAFLIARRTLSGDRGGAVLALRALLAAGENPPMLLGGMAWYFRTALKARAARDRRLSPREADSRYGIDARRAERFGREVGEVGAETLCAALRLCLAADREIKGGGARDPAHAFERLIHRLAGEVRSGA
jgi:DNA polymerase-3 subunit delta